MERRVKSGMGNHDSAKIYQHMLICKKKYNYMTHHIADLPHEQSCTIAVTGAFIIILKVSTAHNKHMRHSCYHIHHTTCHELFH